MTIAISLNVNDGVVLATDSAGSKVAQSNGAPPTIVQVYNNANKIVNLRKGLPVGAIFWGNGAIGKASISTLLKDLRLRFSSEDTTHTEWHLDPLGYTVLQVAEKVKQFLIDEHYTPAFAAWPQKPPMGVLVAGYSAGSANAEEYKIEVDAAGVCNGPVPARPSHDCGVMWAGEPEAVNRLMLGFSPSLVGLLAPALGVTPEQVSTAMQQLLPQLTAQVIDPAMPIKDAIDLVEFLVEVTSKYSRYTPGAATVGGPVEIAAITKHEGFRWVKRKYYFSAELNPEPQK